VIQGDRDDLVDANAVDEWARASGVSTVVRLAEADHFFHARLHELRDALTAFLASTAQARSV
jgi:alpha/beta superfamily hydrolase